MKSALTAATVLNSNQGNKAGGKNNSATGFVFELSIQALERIT
jgi:hypothetical protein